MFCLPRPLLRASRAATAALWMATVLAFSMSGTSRAAEPDAQAPIGLALINLPVPAGFSDAIRVLPRAASSNPR